MSATHDESIRFIDTFVRQQKLRGDTTSSNGASPEREGGMRFFNLAELRERVASRPAGFLIEGLWPEDAYGVTGAEDKAGKSWALADLGVSVATGTKWLGRYECPQGPALVLWGEGGDRNLLRRLDAICRGRDIEPGELDEVMRVALSVPRLDRRDQVDDVARELEALDPRVVLLDPLYLAAGAGKGRDLYAMGESLQAIQTICQEADAALVVTTHWNKTGEGSGASRFTGVGPGAWGRVLASAEVEQRKTEPDGRSFVSLLWELTGGEIPDTRFRMQRHVWVDDPDDLSSDMHYEVEVTEEGVEAIPENLSPSQDRIISVMREGGLWSVMEIGDALARDGRGHPLKKRTIQNALKDLAEKDLVDGEEQEGKAGSWWIR